MTITVFSSPRHQFVGGRGPQPQAQSIVCSLDLFLAAIRQGAGQELVALGVVAASSNHWGAPEQGEKGLGKCDEHVKHIQQIAEKAVSPAKLHLFDGFYQHKSGSSAKIEI